MLREVCRYKVTNCPVSSVFPIQRNLTEYFVAVDVNNMLHLYASMLHERRIIITSSKLSTLTACVHGSAAMLFPMNWQHIYIPVLPPHLLDYCCAPMPYLVGVHLSLLEVSQTIEDTSYYI
uniref:UDENN domain-containing protein n=1 Tax=Hucho hucho TaxID=62062 RepID=A0A4W5RZ47_9TELE